MSFCKYSSCSFDLRYFHLALDVVLAHSESKMLKQYSNLIINMMKLYTFKNIFVTLKLRTNFIKLSLI